MIWQIGALLFLSALGGYFLGSALTYRACNKSLAKIRDRQDRLAALLGERRMK